MKGHIFGQRVNGWFLMTSLQNMKDNLDNWKVTTETPAIIEVAMRLCVENELAEGWGWDRLEA